MRLISDLLGLIFGHDNVSEQPNHIKLMLFAVIVFVIVMLYFFGNN